MQERLNRYSPTKQITSKPFGSVYLAHTNNLTSQKVVLKVFKATFFTSDQQNQNFLQQLTRISGLKHPSIVPILDFGIEQRQPYVVREYLASNSLRQEMDRLSPRGMDLQDALKIILQVGQVLRYAHQHEIFHGNLKPENIFLTSNDEIFISDFGITSFLNMMKTQDQSDWQTTGYLAPEQLVGSITHKSDQYALGCLTYELLTGHIPFSAQSFSPVSREKFANATEKTGLACENSQCPDYRKVGGDNVRKFGKTRKGAQRWQCKTCRTTWSFSPMGTKPQTGPLLFSNLVDNLPESIQDIVFKAMAQNPSERYANISIFLNALQIASSLPTSLSTSSPVPTVPTHIPKLIENIPSEVSIPTAIHQHKKQIPNDYYGSKALKMPNSETDQPNKVGLISNSASHPPNKFGMLPSSDAYPIVTSSGMHLPSKDRGKAFPEERHAPFNKPFTPTLWLAFALSGIILLLGTLVTYVFAPLPSPASSKPVKSIPTTHLSTPITSTPTVRPTLSMQVTPTRTAHPPVQITPTRTAYPPVQTAPYSPKQQWCNPFMFQPCNSPHR